MSEPDIEKSYSSLGEASGIDKMGLSALWLFTSVLGASLIQAPLHRAMDRPASVLDWSQNDVQAWIRDEKLEAILADRCAALGFTGPMLLRLGSWLLVQEFGCTEEDVRRVAVKLDRLYYAERDSGLKRLTPNGQSRLNFYERRIMTSNTIDLAMVSFLCFPRITLITAEVSPLGYVLTDRGDGLPDEKLRANYYRIMRAFAPYWFLLYNAKDIFGGIPWYFQLMFAVKQIDEWMFMMFAIGTCSPKKPGLGQHFIAVCYQRNIPAPSVMMIFAVVQWWLAQQKVYDVAWKNTFVRLSLALIYATTVYPLATFTVKLAAGYRTIIDECIDCYREIRKRKREADAGEEAKAKSE